MSHQVPILERLLSANAQWADAVQQSDPKFFPTSSKGQYPKVLWIGCADSRVPESVITNAKPGDIFVHRNIANQFNPKDDSAHSVLAYAVKVVGVEHVVVVGHTRCGGAIACYDASLKPPANPESPLDRWLTPLTELARSLNLPPDRDAAISVLIEENVKEQVKTVCQAEPIQSSWKPQEKGKPVSVHGWIYDIATGRIKDLNITQPTQ